MLLSSLSSLTLRFREQCEGIARQLEEAPRNLWEAMSRDWLPIEERTFSFDACARQADRGSPWQLSRDFSREVETIAAAAAQVAMLRSCTLNQLRAFVKEKARADR